MTKVLLVDDDTSILELLQRGLMQTRKYQVVTESDSTLLPQRALAFRPDIIVLDIAMPGMDGGDVAASLQHDKRTKDIPVIFLSSLIDKTDETRAGSQANEQYLVAKPITADELASHIEASLQ